MKLTKDGVLQVIETIFQQLLAVFVILVLWEVFKSYSINQIGAWHIILCTLGVALGLAEGLLIFNKENTFLRDVDRLTRGKIHAGIMFLSCLFITIGISLKIYQKNSAGRAHFTSTHQQLGLASWILVVISVFLGAITANAQRFKRLGRPLWFRATHLVVGVAAYIIGIVAVGFGLTFIEHQTGEHGKIALLVFMSLYVAYSLVGSIRSCYNYFFFD